MTRRWAAKEGYKVKKSCVHKKKKKEKKTRKDDVAE
jgi:hypothetical protein